MLVRPQAFYSNPIFVTVFRVVGVEMKVGEFFLSLGRTFLIDRDIFAFSHPISIRGLL